MSKGKTQNAGSDNHNVVILTDKPTKSWIGKYLPVCFYVIIVLFIVSVKFIWPNYYKNNIDWLVQIQIVFLTIFVSLTIDTIKNIKSLNSDMKNKISEEATKIKEISLDSTIRCFKYISETTTIIRYLNGLGVKQATDKIKLLSNNQITSLPDYWFMRTFITSNEFTYCETTINNIYMLLLTALNDLMLIKLKKDHPESTIDIKKNSMFLGYTAFVTDDLLKKHGEQIFNNNQLPYEEKLMLIVSDFHQTAIDHMNKKVTLKNIVESTKDIADAIDNLIKKSQ